MTNRHEFTPDELRVIQYSLWSTRDALDPEDVPEYDTDQIAVQIKDSMIVNDLLLKLFGTTEETPIRLDDIPPPSGEED